MVPFIQKASQQALSEALGFDEAKAYYLLLNKKKREIEEEFSYSKKYRLLKSLFESGAVGKFKPENQDFFSYFLLPPSFLYFEDVDREIVDYLEKIYLENFKELFEQDFSQIILKDDRPLLLFLLKYFMKESARLAINELEFENILGKDSDKVTLIKSQKETKREFGIIDRNFAFEFVSVMGKKDCNYIGYITKNGNLKDLGEKKDYVSLIEKEMEMVC